MPWSSASEQAPKWPISGHYAVEPVVTPIEMKGERRLEALQPVKPNMHRQQTNFTEATSVSSGSGGFGASQGSLQKENVAEAEGTDAALKNTAAQHPTSAVISRPLSFVGSNSSSLAAARKAAIPPTSQSRPTSAIFGSTSSVAAVARELQQRSNTPSRPSSPEKFASSSPTKAKDLIAMFESSSATASPSSELARNVTPKSKLKRGVVDVDPPLRRQTPLGVSVARSNVGLADESPVSGKLRAQRDDAGGVRVRPAGMVILDDDANVPANADDGSDENAAPGSVISATRSASGRFRSHGSNSQHSQQQSTKAPSVSSPIATPTKRAPGDVLGKGVVSGSPARKPSFRNSVLGFLTGKPTSTSLETPVSSATLGPTLLTQRRNSAQSDAAQSTASIATTGTVASYRHLVETGNLPLTTTTAISMTHTPPGTPPLRSGVLYYFNVHDAHPRWLRVKAVLLPSAVAMSWIPVGGGRENVVLDLRACREVHSVPSPDHPSSAEDVGATAARSQGLDGITPFQMIFDDGVERLAADSARERVVWVAAVWDVVGAGAGRVESDGGSIMVDAGHDQVSARSGSNEEAIERIGSVWKSELSSAMTDNVQPSFGVAMTIAAANVAPPVPPKEVSAAPAAASRVARALPTPTLAVASSTAAAASSTPPATSTSSPRPKARTWQRPPLDPLTDPIHDPTSKQTIVHPTTAAKSTPASHASSSAVSSSHTAKTTTSSIPSSPELAGYASARSTPTLDEFGPRSPVTEAHFHWSSLDKESDLHPSDSASQRPARSELGSISSDERTPAQMLRDAVMGDRLGTVVEETLSQTQYTQLNVRTRSEVSDASISSREVNALLSLLEDQQRARASKERELEEQIKGFQEAVESLQRKSSIPRSLVAGDGGSELAKMQERLGRVLDLVSAPPAHGRVRSEASVSLGDETDVEDVLARVLRRMQVEDGVGSDMVRGVSAPGQSSTAMNAGDTRRRLSASLPGTSDLDATSALSRLPPRSWTSSKGVPSPPPNSERDARSLLDRPASRATLDSRAPAQNFRMLADPTSAAAPRPLMVEPSYGTLDMEAEIRRRRAAASGAEGGWYTPKVEGLESTCSVTAEDMNVNLDKPVPPTPSVRFAPSDIAPAPTVPGTSGAGLVAMPAVDQTTNTELATILQALHQTEQARLTQAQQQTEISRYLNELNAWLERDVVDRSHEWKTLASGVTQLADELRALKEGRTLPAATTPVTPIELGDAPAEAGDEGKKGKKEKELVTLGNKAVRRKPAGTRYFNSSERETKENDWYRPASPVEREPTLKSRAAKVAAAAGGALMIRHALSEWDKFKSTRREAGLAESPLPEEATGDTGNDSQLPLPEPVLAQLKDAADKEDKEKVGEVVKEAAEKGYGTQAIIELTKHVESKDAADEKDDEELPTEAKEEEDDGVTKMATPVPARVAAKEKAKPDAADAKEGDAVESKDAADVGPSTAALATAVEEILKHLLVTKEEASKKASSPATLDAKDKTELVDLLYTRLAADKAAEEAKAKDLDPKTAIESLVVAINAQKENELRAAAAADAAMRQLTSDLLKTASEQNSKLVEAVAAASRDMLRQNVQQHADEFKRLLHAEVTGMFEDVGRIREAKRHLEFEIADLWGIKNRHLQGAGGGLGGYGTPDHGYAGWTTGDTIRASTSGTTETSTNGPAESRTHPRT
uniref:PH domain-containing protein n=1 Tax=Kalmanozyma brasiliensis (strain GHG001) TaxID=1365824 RepID=V5EVW8_KALBG